MLRNAKLYLFVGAVSLLVVVTAQALMDEVSDPDLLPGFQGHFDAGDYIRRRDEFIALLRGNDPNRPIDPTARSRAIAVMDKQMAALRAAAEKSKGTNRPLVFPNRSEEHTSELQSLAYLVCRLLLEKKKK